MKSSAMLINKGFEGVMQGATLSDLVQMECLSLTTRAVRVDHDGQSGRLFFAGGQIVHAERGTSVGEEALFEMLHWPNGNFNIEEGVRPMEETIERDWHSLLIEGAHRADEFAQRSPALVSLPVAPPMDPISEAFNDLEITRAIHFQEDGTLLHTKGEDPDGLQCTFAYVVQLLHHVGTSLGAEDLREIHITGAEQKAVCLINEKGVSTLVGTIKANFSSALKKLG